MMTLAWIGTLVLGVSLSLLGSTGTLLVIPVMVYIIGINTKLAIASSLAVIGCVAFVNALAYLRTRLINWPSVFLFGIPSMIGTYYGAVISKLFPDVVQLFFFAILSAIAAIIILRPLPASHSDHERHTWQIVIDGLVIGIVTGLVGIGGGFLIIPALIVMGSLDLEKAMATSFIIVAIKSLSGFYKYIEVLGEQELYVDYELLIPLTLASIAGSLINRVFKHKIPKPLIRKLLAFILISLSAWVLYNESRQALEFLS